MRSGNRVELNKKLRRVSNMVFGFGLGFKFAFKSFLVTSSGKRGLENDSFRVSEHYSRKTQLKE